jgi:hypothetical protein
MKTTCLSLSLCLIFNVTFSQTPDTTVMSVGIWYCGCSPNGSYTGPGDYGGGGWGGNYNLTFDQTRTNMRFGDRMYIEMQTYGNQLCGSFQPWHKLTDYLYPVNWYNDTAGYAFKGSTNGTIHTSIDISPYFCSVATIYLRFVYVSATAGPIHANISNARYDLAPIHFLNPSVSFNGNPCDVPLTANFSFPVFCSKCPGGGSSSDTYVEADFGDGSDTAYIQFYSAIYQTFYLNHTYNSSGTFHPTFDIENGYGGEHDTLTISNHNPAAAITASSTTFCSGDSVVLNAAYNPDRTYQWNKGGINIPGATTSSYTTKIGGSYRVTVTNTISGCLRTTAPATILTKYQSPVPSITPQGPTNFCFGDSVVLTANAGTGLIYKWKKDGLLIIGATLIDYSAKTAGEYKVQEINNYGCKRTSGGVMVTVPCREDESLSSIENELIVYPNPSSGIITIKSGNENISQITITSLSGQTIYKKEFPGSPLEIVPIHREIRGDTYEIDLTNQSKGIYLVQVITDKEVYNEKIILN